MNSKGTDHPMTSMFDPCRLAGRLFYLLVSLLLACGVARAVPPQTTTIADTVYRADGSPASGTLLITWPQFNTSDNKAVASGTLNVTIGAGGAVSIALAPNAGASPAGTYYKVTYKLDDGTSSTEYWTVPSTSPTTISAIRSTVVPASMAVQVVSRSYVDSGLALKAADNAVVHKAGDSMTGPLTLNGDPSAALHAATKSYVDTHAGSTPGEITVDGTTYPTIQSAVNAAGTSGSVLIPPNYSGTDTYSNPNRIQITDLRGFPNRQRGYINVLTDCGLKGSGLSVDGAAESTAIAACLAAFPSARFYFPQTNFSNNCSYYFASSITPPVGSAGTVLTGGSGTFLNSVSQLGGTVLCFPAGITGINLQNCGCTIEYISLLGSEGTNQLGSSLLLNIPSSTNLPLFTRSISSIQRAANVLTVAVTRVNGLEGLTQQVGSTVKISGVVGDATMNGLCIVTTLSGNTAFGGNPNTFTCAQNGADSGPFGAVGTIGLPTTGASTADGIRVCNNFSYINHVTIQGFGRHGINADSLAGHGCTIAFSDDLIVRDSFLTNNQGNGYLCFGVDCNAHLLSGNAVYYNVMWGLEDQSSLGNTHIGNQISNNGHFWAATTTPPTKAISTVTRTSGMVAAVLSVADTFLKLGSCVVVAGVTDASFNTPAGQCFFITSYTDSTHFSYIQPGTPGDASSSGGTSRIAKFSEAYLSAGIDDGAQKIATQAAVATPVVVNSYVEGGQNCKWGINTLLVGGANTPGCAVGGDWTGQFISSNGCSGLGGQLCLSTGAIVNNKDFGANVNLRSGINADQTFGFTFLNHSNTPTWAIINSPAGTVGGSGYFHITSQGYGQTRLYAAGLANGGDTIVAGEGPSGRVLLNYQNAGSNAGQGGVLFCSGGSSSTCLWGVNNAGIATMAAFKSVTASPAAAGAVRLAKTDAVTFRNNANSADVTALSLNASDQVLLPTVAALTSAGSVTSPALTSSSANAASTGAIRLAQADGVKFRNNANTADLNVLSEASDVLQVGEASNGINVPGPANFANLTASGSVTAGSISTGGDSFAGTPRIAWGSFLPGALTSTWTAAQFTPKKGINVVQIDLRAKAGPAGCTTFPVVQVTDGTTPINVTLNAAGISQNVAGGQNYAANSTVQVKVSTAGAGCTTNASDVNVTVQYKMQ